MVTTQWFDECISCGKLYVSVAPTRSKQCIDCGAPLAAVGGVVDGARVDVPLLDSDRQWLRDYFGVKKK